MPYSTNNFVAAANPVAHPFCIHRPVLQVGSPFKYRLEAWKAQQELQALSMGPEQLADARVLEVGGSRNPPRRQRPRLSSEDRAAAAPVRRTSKANTTVDAAGSTAGAGSTAAAGTAGAAAAAAAVPGDATPAAARPPGAAAGRLDVQCTPPPLPAGQAASVTTPDSSGGRVLRSEAKRQQQQVQQEGAQQEGAQQAGEGLEDFVDKVAALRI